MQAASSWDGFAKHGPREDPKMQESAVCAFRGANPYMRKLKGKQHKSNPYTAEHKCIHKNSCICLYVSIYICVYVFVYMHV